MKIVKSIAQEVAYRVLMHLSHAAATKSRWRTHREMNLAADIITWVLSSRNNVIKENLARVFPQWSRSQIKEMSGAVLEHLAHNIADFLYFPNHPQALQDRTIINGLEHFRGALSLGRGAIVVTGHYGEFPLTGVPAAWEGHKLGIVAKDPHDRRLSNILRRLANSVQMQFIGASSPTKAAIAALRLLKRGGVNVFIFDQHPGKGNGVEVDFLGQKTKMYEGMVHLAAKSGAPLVPGVARRTHGNTRFTIDFAPAINVSRAATKPGNPEVQEVMSQLASWLTEAIYKHPEEWWWVHRRWR